MIIIILSLVELNEVALGYSTKCESTFLSSKITYNGYSWYLKLINYTSEIQCLYAKYILLLNIFFFSL